MFTPITKQKNMLQQSWGKTKKKKKEKLCIESQQWDMYLKVKVAFQKTPEFLQVKILSCLRLETNKI